MTGRRPGDAPPPLTDEQVEQLAAILRPALERIAADAARQDVTP